MKPLALAFAVDLRVTRGPRLESHYDVAALRDEGFKTILNLEIRDKSDEVRWCREYGVELVNMDISGIWPSYYDVLYAVEVLIDRAKVGRVYVHCLHSRERTGLVIALYRMMEHGWTAEAAYQEMVTLEVRGVPMHCRWPLSWQFKRRFLLHS